jgi:septum formation protein
MSDRSVEGTRALGSTGARLLGLKGCTLVLASASPRRVELLRGLGIEFEGRPSRTEEAIGAGEAPHAAAERLARSKAQSGIRDGEDALVVGADTLVVLDGEPLGKPRDTDQARDMLRSLSGRGHDVVTGVAVVRTADRAVFSGIESTRVRFRTLDEEEIDMLVGEAMDKAGGYGIQGLASLVVESVDGDYFNVVGLPLLLLRRLVKEAVTR